MECLESDKEPTCPHKDNEDKVKILSLVDLIRRPELWSPRFVKEIMLPPPKEKIELICLDDSGIGSLSPPESTISSKEISSESTISSKEISPESTISSKEISPESTISSKEISPESTISSKEISPDSTLSMMISPVSVVTATIPEMSSSSHSQVSEPGPTYENVPTRQKLRERNNSVQNQSDFVPNTRVLRERRPIVKHPSWTSEMECLVQKSSQRARKKKKKSKPDKKRIHKLKTHDKTSRNKNSTVPFFTKKKLTRERKRIRNRIMKNVEKRMQHKWKQSVPVKKKKSSQLKEKQLKSKIKKQPKSKIKKQQKSKIKNQCPSPAKPKVAKARTSRASTSRTTTNSSANRSGLSKKNNIVGRFLGRTPRSGMKNWRRLTKSLNNNLASSTTSSTWPTLSYIPKNNIASMNSKIPNVNLEEVDAPLNMDIDTALKIMELEKQDIIEVDDYDDILLSL